MVTSASREFLGREWKAVTDEMGIFKFADRSMHVFLHAINADKIIWRNCRNRPDQTEVEIPLAKLGRVTGRLMNEDGSVVQRT